MLESVVIIGILVIIISLFSLNVTRMRAVTEYFLTMAATKTWPAPGGRIPRSCNFR
jgi:hypothetical protein